MRTPFPLLIIFFVAVLLFPAARALALPPMPELEAFIAEGSFVTEEHLEAQGAAIEQRYVIRSYRTRLGLTEQQVRERFPDVLGFVAYLGGGPFDREQYGRFNAAASVDHEDLYLRHNALLTAVKADPENQELLEKMRLNILEMERQGYSPIRVSGAGYDYRDRAEDEADPVKDDRFMIERFAHMLGAIDADTATRIYLFDKYIKPFIDTKDEGLRTAMIESVEAAEGVDPWFLHMIRGVNMERIAWINRGTKYASKTSAEQFDAFHDHLDRAMEHFRAAYEVDPSCPQAPHFMVQCLYPRGSTWEAEGWTWFGRTLIACVDYEPVFDTVRHALKPKWQGEGETRSAFAVWCARPEFRATRLPLYALYTINDILWTYGVDYGSPDWFWDDEKPAIRAVMEGLEGALELGDEINPRYGHSNLAYMYYRYGELKKSAEHIRACEGEISGNARRLLGWDDLRLSSLVLPLVGPEPDIARMALSLEDTQQYARAANEWERVRAAFEADGDELGIACVRDRIQGLRWQDRYESGQWVTLGFDQHLSGWDQHDGIWERIDDNSVKSRQRGSERETLLVADLKTGDWYEYSATVRFVGDHEPFTTIGLVFERGQRKTDLWDQQRYISARLGKQQAGIGWHFAGNDYSMDFPVPEDKTYRMRLLVRGDQVAGYINDTLVGEGEIPNWKPEKEPDLTRIGLGAFQPGDGDAVFSDVRIRKRRPPGKLEF